HMRGKGTGTARAADGAAIVLYVSRWKLLLLSLGAFLYPALCATAIWLANDEPAKRWVGYFCALVIGLASVLVFGMICARWLSSQPMLTATSEGLVVDPGVIGPGLIKWAEIDALIAYRARMQTRLPIDLADPLPVLARLRELPGWQRVLFRFVKGNLRTLGALHTADVMLPISMDDFLTLLEQRYHHELAHHHIIV